MKRLQSESQDCYEVDRVHRVFTVCSQGVHKVDRSEGIIIRLLRHPSFVKLYFTRNELAFS